MVESANGETADIWIKQCQIVKEHNRRDRVSDFGDLVK
jgi:hypothetical protein